MAAQGSTFITPQDVIFSCCVCLDTLAEVYDREDRRIGLHHESSQRYGRITKLYLTGCAHVVCAKHLEGGGKYPIVQERSQRLDLKLNVYRRTLPLIKPAAQSCVPFL